VEGDSWGFCNYRNAVASYPADKAHRVSGSKYDGIKVVNLPQYSQIDGGLEWFPLPLAGWHGKLVFQSLMVANFLARSRMSVKSNE